MKAYLFFHVTHLLHVLKKGNFLKLTVGKNKNRFLVMAVLQQRSWLMNQTKTYFSLTHQTNVSVQYAAMSKNSTLLRRPYMIVMWITGTDVGTSAGKLLFISKNESSARQIQKKWQRQRQVKKQQAKDRSDSGCGHMRITEQNTGCGQNVQSQNKELVTRGNREHQITGLVIL